MSLATSIAMSMSARAELPLLELYTERLWDENKKFVWFLLCEDY